MEELDGNGLDVLAHRRDDAALCKVAVLVLTAQPSLGRQALDLGADRVIAKPFDPDQLADTVGAIIADQTHRSAI